MLIRQEQKFSFYLVVHGFLLADQLGAQDQHLFLADVQLLTGRVELVQQHIVGWRAWGPRGCSCITQQTPPHLCQVMFELLVLRLQLLTLRSESVQSEEDFRSSYSNLLLSDRLP